ncbi:hypothetical protein B0J11DRAFT_81600 [Dendryphion nanum]|uniref:RRM domain-containing protein n=1 Tax=Dendryphion nanum TaxID=256645 RepID=A0A9P9DGY0_9PLEO|nr:hypothetical protein B0J11DRAFT_81600 [Dendryphion nanum]
MSNNHLEPHPSLPARPPGGGYASGPRQNNTARNFQGAASRAPGSFMSAAPSYAPTMASQAPYTAGGYQSSLYDSIGYYQQQQPSYSTHTPPVSGNPYSAPPTGQSFGRPGGFDPEEEARIAEWNSAYTAKDDTATKKPTQTSTFTAKSTEVLGVADASINPTGAGADKGKQKTVVRQGGGKSWEDPSLLEWDPTHPRLFVGNLAGEVTDDSLLKAFSKYDSVAKARVVRDKKSTKSKSYGFVSFADTEDYFRAAREMEGKYIGSHPVRIKRANTEIVASNKKDDKHGKYGKHGKGGQKGGGAKTNPTYTGLGPISNSGVQKYSNKKNNGPRLLG